MPQTLLGLLALAMLMQLTFSQQQVTIKSYQGQLRNEFSVAASGMLMQAMELTAARPFDAASAPDQILSAGGLPQVPNDFGSLGPGGGDTGCDLFDLSDLENCNDLDDLAQAQWWPADVELSNGHSLPFEVQVEVDYVDGEVPDVAVSGPTSTKRVILSVRTPMLPQDSVFIRLERVIAYDAEKASADCIRFSDGSDSEVETCSSPR